MTDPSRVEAIQNCQLDLNGDITDWVAALRQADETFYSLMSIELGAIAQTMDEIEPGFWNLYMQNRQTVMKQYLQERRQQQNRAAFPQGNRRQHSPLRLVPSPGREEAPAPEPEMVSLFSEALEREIPQAQKSPRSLTSVSVTPHPSAPISANWQNHGDHCQIVTAKDLSQPEPANTHPWSAANPSQAATLSFAGLPHLLHPPIVKVLPSNSTNSTTAWAIACWLTRQFLVPGPADNPGSLVPISLNSVILEPGQSIICMLGFELNCAPTSIRALLVRHLRAEQGLEITRVQLHTNHARTSEVAIHLTNASSRSYHLKAGQTFCRLEVTCAVDQPSIRPLEALRSTPIPAAAMAQ